MADIINLLAGIAANDPLDVLRDHRAQAKENAQLSFEALLEPEDPRGVSYRERYAVAAFTAGLLGSDRAEEFYRDLLRDEDEAASWAVAELLDEAVLALDSRAEVRGPYGIVESAALSAESVPGPWFTADAQSRQTLGSRLIAGLEFAHLLALHPRDARPAHLALLLESGWDEDGIVTLAQLVSFLNFQIRISTGLAALTEPASTVPSPDDAAPSSHDTEDSPASARVEEALQSVGDRVKTYPNLKRPELFQQGGLGWVPWIAPVAEADLSDDQQDALIEAGRAKNPYFRLLARDPAALKARTLTDFDIFFNTTDGLGRAERELAATAASRLNGCLFCASVHADRATEESGRRDLVQRLLDEGIGTESRLGDQVWDAVIDASVALTLTPQTFGGRHVDQLRAAGLGDGDIIDALSCAAFFNWANRLMLSLGEPEQLK
ncbi:alkylhydroperoxidase domain protein [Brevibacterium linens]|uniref:CMD domain protein, Avi_7170 family/alkylhydroperoxidase domain protein, Avi_7169 family n=1 Tax=Brevibacterium linens ATCC 9172 TaxID=1255617 RepID=A0A2H1K569_BRELN|nr:alkylhydroperoxidase domain protein [Brevibacterium linens]KAB1948324.1 alkylhydroperoxidase domain protein [Brevibacterium linens ATCC 9172]SMX94945.1 CMD domain protein, Avi_7170 family/alkylhydroperoxidase domain protein, Avi_7169 family [Brevibacterium linens ATCC 9172]